MAAKMAQVLAAGGATHALVVHGADGLDELSTTGPSVMYEWKALPAGPPTPDDADEVVPDRDPPTAPVFAVEASTIDPADLGLRPARLAELLGGDSATNAMAARRVLAGEVGPHRDVVLLNAAAGLVVAGVCDDLAAGLVVAASTIDDGRAEDALNRLVAVSREQADLLGSSGS